MDLVVTFPGGKKTETVIGRHTVITDQPEANGGEDAAPSPFNLFLTSIVSCAGIYVIFFCQKRNIPLDDIRLVQKTERDPETRAVTKISIDVELPEDFPEKYKGALLNAIDLCTVKKTIQNPPEFDVRAVTGGRADLREEPV